MATGSRLPVKLHRRVSLIVVADAILAEELLARKKLAADLVGRLAEGVLLVRPGRAAAVLEELERLGYAPRLVRPSSRAVE